MATISIKYTAAAIGQILISIDGVTFEPRTPLTTDEGWLVNNQGTLLVVG